MNFACVTYRRVGGKILVCCALLAAMCGSGVSYAKSHFPSFKGYADKWRYVDDMRGQFNRKPLSAITDTLRLLIQRATDEGDKELAAELQIMSLWYMMYNGAPIDTIEGNLRLIAANAERNKLRYIEANALQTLGEYYSGHKQQSAAIDQYIAAYELYKNFTGREFPPKGAYVSALGGAFYKLEDNDKALKYFREANEILRSSDDPNYPAIFNTIGLCYRNLKKYDTAIYFFRKAYDQAVLDNKKAYQGIAIGNIGISYFLQKKFDSAIPLLKEDIETSIATHQLRNAAGSMTALATIYNYQHRYGKAESLLKQALQLMESKPFWPDYTIAEPIFHQLYIIYAAKKDFLKATLYADSALAAKDSVTALSNSLTLAKAHDRLEYVQHKLEAEKLQSQVNIARLEISKNRIKMIFAIAGVGILLIVILFIIRLNNKIQHQKNELERINAVKDRMFSTISHDLRAPVNSLVSFTQLLENENISPEKLQQYAGALKDTLGYTAGLMENLLSWARTQMQGYKPVFEKFDVAENVTQAIGLLAPEARKKNIEIVNHVCGNTVVHADFNMTSLVIRNLLSNAIKYTAESGSVTVSAHATRGKIAISIRDTGVGIPADLVARFNNSAAEQPIDSTPGTAREKGTGLGLMLCKGFTGLMHGKLKLESAQGKGSCFIVELPAATT
jgi:signal transduction histidine kinase